MFRSPYFGGDLGAHYVGSDGDVFSMSLYVTNSYGRSSPNIRYSGAFFVYSDGGKGYGDYVYWDSCGICYIKVKLMLRSPNFYSYDDNHAWCVYVDGCIYGYDVWWDSGGISSLR